MLRCFAAIDIAIFRIRGHKTSRLLGVRGLLLNFGPCRYMRFVVWRRLCYYLLIRKVP